MNYQAGVMGAADVFNKLRSSINVGAVRAQTRAPFRFLLCGDPGLISELRSLLLAGGDDEFIPLDAAATLETIDPGRPVDTNDARAIVFLGRIGDRDGARLNVLETFKLPILTLLVDPEVVAPSGPASAPGPGKVEDYIVSRIEHDALKGRFLPHLIDCCKGIEIAVGLRLPALRETVCAKLTRDAAMNALKIAGASALADKIPFVGIVLGAFASAGDMVAITGIQMMLMLQIGAVFGKEPDMKRMWELLPVVGGGFGWRMLSRELSGFIPVAGIFIKGAIAYAGTIVVGESVTFYFLHGRHMSPSDASTVYADAKAAAMRLGREIFSRLRPRRDP